MEKRKINAEIVADSINEFGNRITTYLLTFPRFILPELNTHRLFTRNSASSRAIPFNKMVEMVETDPFIPIAWQKDHIGMQGTEYITGDAEIRVREGWMLASMDAVFNAKTLHNEDHLTKQLCNRLLEPFMWHTVLVTATEYDNFFNLRCPKLYHEADGNTYNSVKDWNKVDSEIQWNNLACLHPSNKSGAEIHIQALAEAMWKAQNESTPVLLKADEWHIPFSDQIDINELHNFGIVECDNLYDVDELKLCIATARCARLSYMTFDGVIDYQKDIDMHDKLLLDRHGSPFEHCSEVMTEQEYYTYTKGQGTYIDSEGISLGYQYFPESANGWCDNFRGFISYRKLLGI